MAVSVIADGQQREIVLPSQATVEDLLASANITLGERDRVSHPLTLALTEGMRVTLRRVREEQICQREALPFQRVYLPYEGIPPGQERLARPGRDGAQESCFRIVIEDDVETGRIALGSPIVLAEPQDELIYVGPSRQAEAMAIPGRLSYINHGRAWTIKGNTTQKRALETGSSLDSLVFSQNRAGAALLYTVGMDEDQDFINELWMISLDEGATPLKLPATDVLYAEWRPTSSSVFAYSTGESGPGSAPWKSLNNLWLMQIDRATGLALSIDEIISERGDQALGWWGTSYRWSPRGDRLAWVRAGAMGIVDLEERRLVTLADYAPVQTAQAWVWLSTLSWSHGGNLIASAMHGAPRAGEPAETSPVFDLMVTSADGRFSALLRRSVGMWAGPAFSPNIAQPDAEYARGYLAWLRSRQPLDSLNAEHDLMIADRDGSNERRLFPPENQPGIRSSDSGLNRQDLAWSPDARFIALIYQGDLWLVEVESGAGHQITFDGGATHPVWTG